MAYGLKASSCDPLNANFDARPVLQLLVISLCVVNQPLNRKIIKMHIHLSYIFAQQSYYMKTAQYENHSYFLVNR